MLEANFPLMGELVKGTFYYAVLAATSIGLSPVLIADVAQQQRQDIDAALIAAYVHENQASSMLEYTAQLQRGDTVQPIRLVHKRDLAASDRVLLVVIDDGARELHTGSDDLVIVGLPLADRIRDLTPSNTETPAEGSPQWGNQRVTEPNSAEFLKFIKDRVVPYAEGKLGPFKHRVLFGYSLGGIFTIQALMEEPELFHSYIAGSPSLWYSYDYYENATLAALKRKERCAGRCLIMSAGEDEPPISNNTRKYQRLLTGIDLPLKVHYQRNMEVDHSHNRHISFLYGWDQIFNSEDNFPPAVAIPSDSVEDFLPFLKGWTADYSCAPFSVARSSGAFSAFSTRLAEQGNWAELKTLHGFVLAEVGIDSTSYGALFGPMISQFAKLPEEEKGYWAQAYQTYMATNPRPGLAIHYINVDVLEFLVANTDG